MTNCEFNFDIPKEYGENPKPCFDTYNLSESALFNQSIVKPSLY